VSGAARQNGADTKSAPVNDDQNPSSAAEMRALAEQAEAEAAEAEALAAAARARARAIQLRREAELAEAKQRADDETVSAKADADVTESVEAEPEDQGQPAAPTADVEPSEEPEAVETEEHPDDAAANADATAEEPARRGSGLRGRLRRPKWSSVAAALAITVIVAALAVSGYMIKEHRDAVRQRQRVAEFAAAARQGVVTLTSLDFNNAKQGVQRIADNSTGSFRDDFLKMADDFTKVVEQSKVVSQGTVQATAVELDSMTDNSAVVLVASTSEVTNAAGAKQDPRNYRLIVTVARDGGQLKISKVEFVP
jgi:Mce-associated membrane protein